MKALQEGALLLLLFQLAVIFLGLTCAYDTLTKLSSTLAFSAHEIGDSFLIVVCVIAIALPLTLVITWECCVRVSGARSGGGLSSCP